MYDIKANDIMRANSLRKPDELEMGQRLLIPDAAPLKAIIPLYPSNKKYCRSWPGFRSQNRMPR
ncbi:MAG: LysM domain-containing protein [Candidatus Omnitrophica bacterium]|nr:LysM domain-containing protein [Candidatus Omnitrophota bacterium]